MDEKKWMLITYYCPTHGDSFLSKPIEVSKKNFSESFFKKNKNSEN